MNINVNLSDTYNYTTTLHLACRYSKNTDIVSKVGRLTDNPNSVNKYGETPAVTAVDRGELGGLLGLMQVPNVNWQVTDKYGDSLVKLARYVLNQIKLN